MYSGGSAGRGENHFLSSSRTVTAVMAVCNVELIKVTNTGGTKKNTQGYEKEHSGDRDRGYEKEHSGYRLCTVVPIRSITDFTCLTG